MIFPGDFKDLTLKPALKLSWVMLFLNVLIYFATSLFFQAWPGRDMSLQLSDENFKNSVVEMYRQSLDPVEQKNLSGGVNAVYSRALKDQKFWSRSLNFPFVGDQVQIRETRKAMRHFFESYADSAQYQFGLGSYGVSPWSWLTYQFVHAGLVHLIGNMLIVFLLISYLERSVSPLWIAALYLLSGFAGGVSFLLFDTVGSLSVIGASASATGLMSFLLATQGSRLMPWAFLVAPVKNGYGQIFLPVFFLFPIFLVSDFVSLLWEPSGVASNVAISAHVGGALMGFLLGGAYLFFRGKTAAHGIFGHDDRLHELP